MRLRYEAKRKHVLGALAIDQKTSGYVRSTIPITSVQNNCPVTILLNSSRRIALAMYWWSYSELKVTLLWNIKANTHWTVGPIMN